MSLHLKISQFELHFTFTILKINVQVYDNNCAGVATDGKSTKVIVRQYVNSKRGMFRRHHAFEL